MHILYFNNLFELPYYVLGSVDVSVDKATNKKEITCQLTMDIICLLLEHF